MDLLAHSPIVQVVAALLAGGLGLPIPEELALVTAGYWLSRGVAAPPMIACAFVAMLAGDALMVLAGRSGARVGLARRCVGAARMATIERAFARHGVLVILGGRFVPGLRSTLLVAAGAAGVPLRRLAAADGAAALVGAALWIALGLRLGPEVARAHTIVGSARGVVLCLAIVVVVALIVRDWRRRATLTTARSSARESSRRVRDRASRSRDRATHP